MSHNLDKHLEEYSKLTKDYESGKIDKQNYTNALGKVSGKIKNDNKAFLDMMKSHQQDDRLLFEEDTNFENVKRYLELENKRVDKMYNDYNDAMISRQLNNQQKNSHKTLIIIILIVLIILFIIFV